MKTTRISAIRKPPAKFGVTITKIGKPKKKASIMLSAESSPTHLYFAEKILEIKAKEGNSNKEAKKAVSGNYNHQHKCSVIKNFKKKKYEEN